MIPATRRAKIAKYFRVAWPEARMSLLLAGIGPVAWFLFGTAWALCLPLALVAPLLLISYRRWQDYWFYVGKFESLPAPLTFEGNLGAVLKYLTSGETGWIMQPRQRRIALKAAILSTRLRVCNIAYEDAAPSPAVPLFLMVFEEEVKARQRSLSFVEMLREHFRVGSA